MTRGQVCGDCEFFGDYDKIVTGEWELVPESGGKFYRRPFLGFDETAGAICKRDRPGTKTRVYAGTRACPHSKPKTWARPDFCHDCDRKRGEMTDGSILCDGWPEYRKLGDTACQNGRITFGKNLSLF